MERTAVDVLEGIPPQRRAQILREVAEEVEARRHDRGRFLAYVRALLIDGDPLDSDTPSPRDTQ